MHCLSDMSLGCFLLLFCFGQNVIIIIMCLKQSSCDCKEKHRTCIQDGTWFRNQNAQFDWCVCLCVSPSLSESIILRHTLKQLLLKVRQLLGVTAWWLNPYTTKIAQILLFCGINFLNNCRIFIYAAKSPAIERWSWRRERRACISTPPRLFTDTCWAAWLISSSFSRLSRLRGADYQEELIPVVLLISLIRAPGRWLEEVVSHACSCTAAEAKETKMQQ